MNNQELKVFTIILVVATIVITLMGGTLAYWSWQSEEAQKTAVTFTVASNFSCSADGGGNITNNDVIIAPATCTNSAHAIKREVKVNVNKNGGNNVYLDMYLNVNSLGTGLSNSQNFKYALTTSSTSCTDGVVAQGNFSGATTNIHKKLFSLKEYTQTTQNDTYYLWIWLDAAETSASTQNQAFDLSLAGSCTDQNPYVYTANIYDKNAQGNNSVWIGQTIPNTITKYNAPELAMTVLKTASGGTTDFPFFLKHTIGDGTLWCANEYDNGVANGNSFCAFPSQVACNSRISEWEFDNYTYSCVQNDFTGGVSESYVGFVVTPTMAANNTGMTAGTYYLKGGDNGAAYEENKAVLQSAFGSNNCTDNSSDFYCDVSGLYADADSSGYVEARDDAGSDCRVSHVGISNCEV